MEKSRRCIMVRRPLIQLWTNDTTLIFKCDKIEFGHALQSLLSRTRFQHLAGTRSALDWVETPAHVFEYFVWEPHVILSSDSRHTQDLIERLVQSTHAFAAMELSTQICYALLDLKLFMIKPEDHYSSTDILADLMAEYSIVPYVIQITGYSEFQIITKSEYSYSDIHFQITGYSNIHEQIFR